MKPEEFVEMAAGLPTSSEIEAGAGIAEADAVLDSMIGVARNIAAQALASADGLLAARLFDELGDRIMGLDNDARVVVRSDAEDREIGVVRRIEFRDDMVSLCIDDAAQAVGVGDSVR